MLFTLIDRGLALALIAAVGGCMVRQSTEYKTGKVIKWQFLVIDWGIALFLGFYTFWYITDEIETSLINACLINIIVGYLGSKVIEISKGMVLRKARAFFAEDKNE